MGSKIHANKYKRKESYANKYKRFIACSYGCEMLLKILLENTAVL